MHKAINRARPGRGGGPSGYFGLLSLESRIMFDGGALDAAADTANESSYVYSRGDSPIVLDGTEISSEADHRGGALVFSLESSGNYDQLELVSDSDIYGEGAVSVDDDGNVYLGNGTDRALIGTIDGNENGQNSSDLKINFTEDFVSDDFETYEPGSFLEESRDNGWFIPDETQGNGEVILGESEFFGWPVPIDDYHDPWEANTGLGTWTMGGSDPSQDYGEQSPLAENTNFLTIGSSAVPLPVPYSVSHGPFAATDEVTLVEGETVRFDWDANPTSLGDTHDPFIYLLNTDNGNTEILVPPAESNEEDAPGQLDWKSVETTIEEAGAYRIVFINGFSDTSGAQIGGSALYIDNVMMGYPVDGTVLTAIANQITFSNSSESPVEGGRNLTVSTESPDGDVAEYGQSTITVVSEGPFLMAEVPGAQTMNEDGLDPLVFSSDGGNPFQIASGGMENEEIRVALTATNGALTLSRTTGLEFGSGNGTNDAGMIFRGTQDEINAALDGMRFSPTTDYNGPASIQIETSVPGNTSPDGPLTGSRTVDITIEAVNDAPVNTIPVAQALDDDSILTFSRANGNPISIRDVDAGDEPIQVRLAATGGTLTLSRIDGLRFEFSDGFGSGLGDGTDDAEMIFRGTQDDINTALEGMQFSPTADYDGSGSIQIGSHDLGNTGLDLDAPHSNENPYELEYVTDTIEITRPFIDPRPEGPDDPVGDGGGDFSTEMPAPADMYTIIGQGMDSAPDMPLVFSDRGLGAGFTRGGDGNFPVPVSGSPPSIAPRGAESAPACHDASGDTLALGQGVENTAILIGKGFELQILYDTFTHTNPEAEIQLSARRLDGSPLPDWLRFDAEKGLFSGQVPVSLAGQIIELEVIARDLSSECEVAAAFSLCMVDDETEVCQPEAMDEWEEEWEDEWEEENGLDEDPSRVNREENLPDTGLPVSTGEYACRASFSAQLATLGRAGFERQQAAFISVIGAGNI